MSRPETLSSGAPQGLLAGEAAKAVGARVQTLHFYEREGLIPPPPRSPAGYRRYPAATIARLHFIRKAQALGLSLDEIREILSLTAKGTSPCGRVQTALATKLAEVDRRLAELWEFRDELAGVIAEAGALAGRLDRAEFCAIVEAGDSPARTAAAAAPLARRTGVRGPHRDPIPWYRVYAVFHERREP